MLRCVRYGGSRLKSASRSVSSGLSPYSSAVSSDLDAVESEFTTTTRPEKLLSLRPFIDSDGRSISALEMPTVQNLGRTAEICPINTSTPTPAESSSTKPFVTVKRLTANALRDIGDELHSSSVLNDEKLADEACQMPAADAIAGFTFDDAARRSMLYYYKRNPVNDLILSSEVLIAGVENENGTMIRFADHERQLLNISDAKRLAKEHGKDLIETLKLTNYEGRSSVSLCYIADHVSQALDDLDYYLSSTVNHPLPVKELLEVGFRGGTHKFAIRFKSRYIAKYLVRRHPVRISLSSFGTAKEGFPVFQHILSVIQEECETKGAWFSAGRIRYENLKLCVHLHPATPRNPLQRCHGITETEVQQALQRAVIIDQYDREVEIPNELKSVKFEGNRYQNRLARGTAWAYRHEGLSLREQRKRKIMQGWIPKGNKKLYSGRGDVELNYPFETRYATSHESVTYPRESNLDQAERGSMVLAKRSAMSITDMYDGGDTEDATMEIGTARYTVQGNALEIGSLKEAFGLKTNRRKVPRFARGFATEGVAEPTGDEADIRS